WTAAKQYGTAYHEPDEYVDIELPANNALGPVTGALGFAVAFGLVWHIWWLVIAAAIGSAAAMIAYGFARNTLKIIPAAEVRREHRQWLQAVREAPAISGAGEAPAATQALGRPRVGEARAGAGRSFGIGGCIGAARLAL